MVKKVIITTFFFLLILVGSFKVYCGDSVIKSEAKKLPDFSFFKEIRTTFKSGECSGIFNVLNSRATPTSITIFGATDLKPQEFFQEFDSALAGSGWKLSNIRQKTVNLKPGILDLDSNTMGILPGGGAMIYEKEDFYLRAEYNGTPNIKIGYRSNYSNILKEEVENFIYLTSEDLKTFIEPVIPGFLPNSVIPEIQDIVVEKDSTLYKKSDGSIGIDNGAISFSYSCKVEPTEEKEERGGLDSELWVEKSSTYLSRTDVDNKCWQTHSVFDGITLSDGTSAWIISSTNNCGNRILWNNTKYTDGSFQITNLGCPISQEELIEIASSISSSN